MVGDGTSRDSGVRPLDTAEPHHLSFLHNPKYVTEARSSQRGPSWWRTRTPLPGRNLLVCPEPYLALANALEIFHPADSPEPRDSPVRGGG